MKIKYMGNADVRRLEKGEDFGGRLGEPLGRDIEWNWENKHVIDTDEFSGVDDEFWTLLLDEDDFKDVSGLKRIPTNEAQQTWLGMAKSEEDPSVKASGTAETDEESSSGGGPSEASAGGATGTTSAAAAAVGGSTKGRSRT